MVGRSLPAALKTRARRLAVAIVASSLAAAAAAAGEPAAVNLAGRRVPLALGAGERALVVHFWATWCESCAEELPVVARADERCAAEGVRVRIVASGESADTVRAFLREHGLAFEPLLDPHGRAWRAAGGYGLPANWVRTPAGDRLLSGPRSPAAWQELLGELGCRTLGSPPPAAAR